AVVSWSLAACSSFITRSRTAVLQFLLLSTQLLLLSTQRDAARFARFRDRDRQHEDAAVIIRRQLVRIEVVAQEQLPGVGAARPLVDDDLVAFFILGPPLRPDAHHVAFHRQLNIVPMHTWEIDMDIKLVFPAPR